MSGIQKILLKVVYVNGKERIALRDEMSLKHRRNFFL